MPDFTPSRSDAIREGLIRHAAASMHGRATAGSASASTPATLDADSPATRPEHRPRRTQWAAAALALVLVGGVVGLTATAALNAGAPAASTPTPSDSTIQPTTTPPRLPSASASPPVSPPSTQAPAQTAPPPVLITADGIGSYLLGGSFAEAREMLGVPIPAEGIEDRCPWFASVGDPETLMTYVIADTQDGVTAADVIVSVAIQGNGTAEDSPQTESGVGLGSSEDEVLAAYPDAVPEEVVHADSALRVTDGENSIVFQFRSSTAYMITVLPAGDVMPAEYCG